MEGGDKNTRFFHASTIQRRGRNRIQRIQDKDGVWVEGQQQLFNLILTHFREVYSSDQPALDPKCLDCIPRLVTTQMNDCLTRRVSSDEIKLSLDSLGAMKVAGLDGLNGLFFQKNWGTVKEDVTREIMDFFENGNLSSEMNEIVVSLIPMVPMPKSINHLRPISCCNFIYKMISKIVVARLRPFMGDLISQNQSAFVRGRLIQDNLIIAQEAFHAFKNKTRGGKG